MFIANIKGCGRLAFFLLYRNMKKVLNRSVKPYKIRAYLPLFSFRSVYMKAQPPHFVSWRRLSVYIAFRTMNSSLQLSWVRSELYRSDVAIPV